jgi:hypothetical protein
MTKRNKFVDDHNVNHLLPLVGGVVTQVLVDDVPELGDTCYGLRIQKRGKNYDCLIMCDPEGNGPGHLMIVKEKR